MKVLFHNFVNIKNLYSQKSSNQSSDGVTKSSDFRNINQISGIYYQPVFCGQEISDEEFRARLSNVSPKLYTTLKKEHADNIFKIINKQNISLAERCLKHLSIDDSFDCDQLYYRLQALRAVNDENKNIAEMLLSADKNDSVCGYEEPILDCVNKDNNDIIKRFINDGAYTNYEISNIAYYANKNNLSLIEYLYDGIDGDFTKSELPLILYHCNGLINDSLSGFGYICKLYAENDTKFPEKILTLLPQKLYSKDIDFMRALFEMASNDSQKELYQSLLPEINKGNVDLAKELFSYDEDTLHISSPSRYISGMTPLEFACELLSVTDQYNIDFAIKMLERYDKGQTAFMNGKQLCSWVSIVNSVLTGEIVWKLYDSGLPLSDAEFLYSNATNPFIKVIAMNNPKEMKEEAEKVIKQIKARPELYVNGDLDDYYEVKRDTGRFVELSRFDIQLLLVIMGKEATDVLLRRRFNAFEEYCKETIDSLGYEDLCLVKDICSSNTTKLSPSQKIEIPEIIKAYNTIKADVSYIKDKLEAGNFELSDIKANLFLNIMKNIGYTESELRKIPKDRLAMWDLNYMYLLPEQIKSDDAEDLFIDVINGSKSKDFKKYIHKTSTEWGEANANTRDIFKSRRMNYHEWLYPSEDNNVIFKAYDKNKDNLAQIARQLNEDVNMLLKSPIRGHVEKVLSQCFVNGEFSVPEDCFANKKSLNSLIQHIISQLDSVWTRANSNINNPKYRVTAQNTLTILDHLNQRLEDLSAIKESKVCSDIEWTIKMWDRVPQKDLFQGNYSTCCVGIGKGNGSSMPAYLLHSALNMIEIVDNKSGSVVGNALCYFVKENSSNDIALVVDNIEINNSAKPSDEIGRDLLSAITKYADNIAKVVTGKENTPILMGINYNDVPDSFLPYKNVDISLLGDIPPETDVYVDVFGGWSVGSSLDDVCGVYILKS